MKSPLLIRANVLALGNLCMLKQFWPGLGQLVRDLRGKPVNLRPYERVTDVDRSAFVQRV